MISNEELKQLIHQPGLSNGQRQLLCLAVEADHPKQSKSVQDIAVSAGIPEAKRWNVSRDLSNLKPTKGRSPYAIRTKDGWELTSTGKQYLSETHGIGHGGPEAEIAKTLRDLLPQIQNERARDFIEEAVRAYECGAYRAAVVFSWVGAVDILHEFVVENRLDDFNQEAQRRYANRHQIWTPARTTDDLGAMKESEFLDVIGEAGIGVIGKNVKQELKNRLQLRNGSGHPNSLQIKQMMAAAHIESLANHVYTQFT